ncbi:MAG: hypothetical protein WD335_03535 [Candidatus Paceibacterota bacterium]
MKYLKAEKYYSKLHDRHTVEKCRRLINRYAGLDLSDDKYKDYDEDELKRTRYKVAKLELYFLTGDRYLSKEDTINDWMERDKAKDKQLDEATPPDGVICDTCSTSMTYKDKMFDTSDPKRVIFFFKCSNNHLPHKYAYSDGTVWSMDPEICSKCDCELEESSTKSDKEIVTKYTCTNCDYSDTDTINLETGKPEDDPHFKEDRERFCLSKEAGEAYREARNDFNEVRKLATKWQDEKEHEGEKARADAIERLTVPHIKRKVSALFEKKDLEEITFGELEVSPQSTHIKFSAEDLGATKENSRGRCLNLRKEIIMELENTNWRLMSEGVSYHLGIMSGRLRVYESDDDIYNLIKRESN